MTSVNNIFEDLTEKFYKIAGRVDDLGAVVRYIENPVGTSSSDECVLPRRPGNRRQSAVKSIRSDLTQKADTIMLDMNYKAKSRMDSVNYETKLPSVPNNTQAEGQQQQPPQGGQHQGQQVQHLLR